MVAVLGRLVADAALVAIALFASAGTLSWPRAWILLAVLLVVRIASALALYRVNPALIRDRAKLPIHREQPAADRLLLLAVIGSGFIGLPIVAGLDVFHWTALPRPSPLLAALGLIVFTLGWVMKALALGANAFATSVVRLQHERHHVVVDTGVYRVVRHPFYTGTPLVLIGMSLWLESFLAVLLAVVPIAFLVWRIKLEERFLRRELPGYVDYATRVRHRLVPGIW